MRFNRAIVWLALTVTLLSGCAGYRYTRRADEAKRADNWDAAVYYYLEALASDPGNPRLRMELQRARFRAAEQHFRMGMRFKEADQVQRAALEFELAVQLDPTHQYAEVELRKAREALAILMQENGQAKLEALKAAAADLKVKPPMLSPTSGEPITLSFPSPTNVKDIYKAIGQAFGFNVLFDPRLKENRVSLELRDVSAERALETVMQSAGHFYKVIDEKTILVAEDTPQLRREYEDLVVKTFFLSNADVKDVNNMLRSLIDARRIAVNERLNSIVIRDTADKVAIAERLIAANDKSKAEVVIDVELIQVDSSKLQQIGMSLSSYTFPITFDPTDITGSATNARVPLPDLSSITRSMWGMVVPNVTISLVRQAGEAETLAQPQLRVTEGEKGKLVIGDRVPIPTTTFNTGTTVGGNIVPVTAFQYQDVGITIDVEPRVHHNNEVTMKLAVEVSELGENVQIAVGQEQPKIGTRTITSVIRLKDGETSLLAGLFKYNKREGGSGIPFLADIPVIGALFRSNSVDMKKTDLVLTLTPHIIRNPDITLQDLEPLWVGTENRVTIFGNSPRVQSAAPVGPFGSQAVSAPNIFGEGAGEAPPPPEEPPAEEPEEQPVPVQAEPRRMTIPAPPPTPAPNPGDSARMQQSSLTSVHGADGELRLARVAFYPQRLPVVLGQEGSLLVALDIGSSPVAGPFHLAYDASRLEVVRVDEGDVPAGGRNARVTVTHTPALGWLTVGWSGQATGSGTLMKLTVRPRQAGELPLVFAGPMGQAVAEPATVIAVPSAVSVVSGGDAK